MIENMTAARRTMGGALAFLAVLLATLPARAVERFWIDNTGTDLFMFTSNWSAISGNSGGVGGASVPGLLDTAHFDLAGTYTVDFFAISPTNNLLEIDAGAVTFDLSGNTYTVNVDVQIGTTFGSTARLTLFGGTLDVNTISDEIRIGTTDADGFLTVSTHAIIGAGGTNPNILIGNSGDGTLTINNGGIVNSAFASLGSISAISNGTATVTGPGSQWNNAGGIVVGNSGNGTLNIQNGGAVTGALSDIGSLAGSVGNATVTGAGSKWTETSSFKVGNFGIGSLTISAGGEVAVSTGVSIGSATGSIGTVSVSGAGSSLSTGGVLTVADAGRGTLAISSGGQVTSEGLTIGKTSSATTEGTVSITGTGSSLTATGTVDIGDADTGLLTVSNGGALITTFGADIGNLATGIGEVTITGTNAQWTNLGTINVARLGAGTLTVASGGAVTTTSLNINDPAGSPIGTLNFDGGSITTGSFTRAAGGVVNWTDGTLTLTNGAYNNASASLTINGASAGDLPTLHLSGSSTGTGFGATTLTVGQNHAGELELTGSSTLSVANIFIGSQDGGNGTVSVRGNLASLTSAGQLIVGGGPLSSGGEGTLNIGLGATVAVNGLLADALHIWSGGTVNLDGGTLTLFSFVNDAGHFNFNSGTVHFTTNHSGNFGQVYDSLLGFEHRLTAGKTIVYDGNFIFTNMNLIVDGGRFTQIGALTVSNNSILDMRSGTLSTSTLTGNANGQIVLEGGSLALTTTFTNPGDLRLAATSDFSLISGTTLTNTGLIHGNGQIGMGLTNNSAGQVHAAAGERMAFTGASSNNGTGRIEISAGGDLQFQSTLANNAAIDVIGGTLRVEGLATNAASTGRITGRDAILRFNGGLTNSGSLALSFGTSDVFGDITNAAVTGRIVVSGNSNATFYDDLVNNGAVQVSAGSTAVYFGTVSGPGSFPGGGTNFFEGDLAPGASPAVVNFGGSVFLGPFATLKTELGGTTPGTQHDQVNVTGTMSIDGTLALSTINGFVPTVGDKFTIATYGSRGGTFAGITGQSPAPGVFLNEIYRVNDLILLATAPGEKTWGVDASGNASVGANWIGGVAPGGVGDAAAFTTIITAPRTVMIDAPLTLGTLRFDDGNNYTLAGPNTITLQNSGANHAAINVLNLHGDGQHTISAPLFVAGDLDIAQNSAGELTLSGGLATNAGRSITKTGAGTLSISGLQSYGVGASFTQAAGTLNLLSDAGAGGPNLTLVAGSTTNLTSSQHLAALAIGANVTATLAAGGGKVLTTRSLVVDAGEKLDLTDNDFVLRSAPANRLADAAAIEALVTSGFSAFAWNGPGINSSAAAGEANLLTALGVMLNDDGFGGPFRTLFSGEAVDANSVLVKYTYYGDADLSGSVDGTDYALIDNGFNSGLSGWFNGDFDYSGAVDGTDYALIDNAFNSQTGPLGALGPIGPAVPEPGTLSLAVLAATGLLVRLLRSGTRLAVNGQ